VIREILCNQRVEHAAVEERFGIRFREYFSTELADLAELAADGLLELSDDGLRVTPKGNLLLRNLAMPFDWYLREKPPARATYSRTV
jgi:oxygen-independent coproporphyrinogen-3 oxidase